MARNGTIFVRPSVDRKQQLALPRLPPQRRHLRSQKAVETKPKPAMAPAVAPAPTGNAIFPSAIDPRYAKESAGKARMHTCVDQYNANKVSNANGGLKWIERGGGYYSECNKKLKS